MPIFSLIGLAKMTTFIKHDVGKHLSELRVLLVEIKMGATIWEGNLLIPVSLQCYL